MKKILLLWFLIGLINTSFSQGRKYTVSVGGRQPNAQNNWRLTGNPDVSSVNFFGSINDASLLFKLNNHSYGFLEREATGAYNTALGAFSLSGYISGMSLGTYNTSFGAYSMQSNTDGSLNTSVGHQSLQFNSIGNGNAAFGQNALQLNSAGSFNNAFGGSALMKNETGNYNIAFGQESLFDNTTGSYNIGLGYASGSGLNGSNTLYVSDNTNHMRYALDSASGVAPSVISKDAQGYWHVYAPFSATGVTSISSPSATLSIANPTTVPTIDINLAHSNFFTSNQSATTFGIGTGSALPTGLLQVVEVASTTGRGSVFDQYINGSQSSRVAFRKARGSLSSPSAVQSTDSIARLAFQGHDGTSFITAAAINVVASGTIGTGLVPATMNFQTSNTAGSLLTRLTINEAGNVGVGATSPADLFSVGASSQFQVSSAGKIKMDATNTAVGTTGNQTINKPSGTVNIAAAGTNVTVTNSLVTTSSIIYAVIRTNDANVVSIKSVVPGSGSFVINLTTAVAAEVSIGFVVLN